MGIEPTLQAWEACVLPLNYTREHYLHRYASTKSVHGQKEIDTIIFLLISRCWRYNFPVVTGWSLKEHLLIVVVPFRGKSGLHCKQGVG